MPVAQLSEAPVLNFPKKPLAHFKLRPAGPADSGPEPVVTSTDPAPVHVSPETAVQA